MSGVVTFAPNQTTAFIAVPIVPDALAEGDETFLVTLSAPGGGAVLGSPASAIVTIVDDESVVQFSRKFVGNMPEVVRTGPTNTEITVDFFSEDGTATAGVDYTLESGTLTFKVGQSLAYIPLVIKPDVVAEGPETFTVSPHQPPAAGLGHLGPLASQTLTITDNDFGGTVQFGVATLTASPGESKTIPIVRTGGGGTILTVNWQAISGDDVGGLQSHVGQRDLRRQRDDQELHDRDRRLRRGVLRRDGGLRPECRTGGGHHRRDEPLDPHDPRLRADPGDGWR